MLGPFLHHGVSFYWDIISQSRANETLVNTLLFAFFYIYMRDIGVVIAFCFHLSCFASECGWDMGCARSAFFICSFPCEFPCIDTHLVSWHYRSLTRPPLSLDWDLSSSSHSLSLLSPFVSIFTACRHSVVGNSLVHLPISLHDCTLPEPAHSFLFPIWTRIRHLSSLCLFYHHSLLAIEFLCFPCFFPLVSSGWLHASSS